jgi:hypothetical protein
LECIAQNTPPFFEKLIIDVLVALTSEGPAGERYIAKLRNLEGGVVGGVYSGDDRFAARPAIENAIGNICEGAALARQRRMAVLH